MRGGRGMLGNAEVLFVPRAACSATPKSCFFLGRHARQRRSLVCSSGGMLGNAEVLFLPRAACSATPKSCFFLGRSSNRKHFIVPNMLVLLSGTSFLADNVTFNCPLSVLLKWRGRVSSQQNLP